MPTYQTRNPLARTSPLRSIPLFQAPGRLLPMSEQGKAEWALAIAVRDLPIYEKGFAYACEMLGNANRMCGPMRRFWQAKAFRDINSARAQLRAARKALAVAQIAMLQFAPALAA